MEAFDLNSVLNALKSALPLDRRFIGLHEPQFEGKEWAYVKECLNTRWVSSAGKFVDRFEEQLAEFTGCQYVIAVVNGTAALHICLKLVNVRDNDEVLLPALTFVATANTVSYCGAVPHFVDSAENTLGLDPLKLESYLHDIARIEDKQCINRFTKRQIKAIIPMHTFGHPVDMEPLLEVCKKYHLEIVEDATESLGSFYKGKHTGNWGRLSALSFNGNKIITTGGGGAILTNNPDLAQQAKHLTSTAKIPHRWKYIHDQIGYNYRLPNLNAALGCAQLEQLSRFLEDKRFLAESYQKAFSQVTGVRFFTEPVFARSNYWLNALLLDEIYASQRDTLLAATNDQGIMTRPVWTLLHKLPMFEQCPRMDLQTSESIERRLINLPSNANLIRQRK